MYAETVLRTTGDVSEAIDFINQIRKRSGVLELNEDDYDVDQLLEHIMFVESLWSSLQRAYDSLARLKKIGRC